MKGKACACYTEGTRWVEQGPGTSKGPPEVWGQEWQRPWSTKSEPPWVTRAHHLGLRKESIRLPHSLGPGRQHKKHSKARGRKIYPKGSADSGRGGVKPWEEKQEIKGTEPMGRRAGSRKRPQLKGHKLQKMCYGLGHGQGPEERREAPSTCGQKQTRKGQGA